MHVDRTRPHLTPPRGLARLRAVARRGVALAVAALALALGAAACSTPGDPYEDMRLEVNHVAMTLAGAAMTIENIEHLPSSATAGKLALTDDAGDVAAAEHRILLLDIGPGDEPTRRHALHLVREASDALARARAQLADADPGHPVDSGGLRDVADRLLELSDDMAVER